MSKTKGPLYLWALIKLPTGPDFRRKTPLLGKKVLFSLARALVLMRFRLFTLKRSKTIELKVVTYVELNWACYKHTRLRYFRPSFFGPCTLIRYVRVFVLNHFQGRF